MRILLAAITCAKDDPEANLAVHLELLHDARRQGCDLAVFPEMSLTGSVDPRRQPERLVAIDDDLVRSVVDGTRRTQVAASFGIAERSDERRVDQPALRLRRRAARGAAQATPR